MKTRSKATKIEKYVPVAFKESDGVIFERRTYQEGKTLFYMRLWMGDRARQITRHMFMYQLEEGLILPVIMS